MRHKTYGNIFKSYLEKEAFNYLDNSSVKEKDNHLVFINYLLACYDDPSLLKKLETYSKIKKF